MKQVIINADDFGLTTSVNQAIIEVYKAGNLTSATLLVHMPGTKEAVEMARQHPGLAVGLHFCLTEGAPVSRSPNLMDGRQQRFPDRKTLFLNIIRGRIKKADIVRELEAQLAQFKSFGWHPTHIDSHQHVHMFPPVFKAVAEVARKRDLPLRIAQPPAAPVSLLLKRPVKYIKQKLLEQLALRLRRQFTGKMNDYLVSVHELDSNEKLVADVYESLLMPTPHNSLVELMVHPYILGEDIKARYAGKRKEKQRFLSICHHEYKVLRAMRPMDKTKYQLTNYAQR